MARSPRRIKHLRPRHANPSSGKPFVVPDFYLIKFDITPHISGQPKYVVSAHEVYLVDLARHVHIASMTPSIEGEFLYTTCEVDSRCYDLSDRAQERALALIGDYEIDLQSYTEPVTYFDARTVQDMTASPVFGYKVKLWPSTLAELRSGEITYEEVVADLCEEYRSNHHL